MTPAIGGKLLPLFFLISENLNCLCMFNQSAWELQLHISSRKNSLPWKRKSNDKKFFFVMVTFVSMFPSFSFSVSCRGSEKDYYQHKLNKKKLFMTSTFMLSEPRGLKKMRLFSPNHRKQLTTAEPDLWRRLFVMKWKYPTATFLITRAGQLQKK